MAAALVGTEGLLRRPLIGQMSVSSIVLAEYLLLAVFAVPVAIAHRRQLIGLSRRDWVALLIIGWGASAGAALLFTKALESGSPTTASLLQNMQPLIVVVLAMVILKERLSRYYWPCLAASMLGAYLLTFGTLRPMWLLDADQAAAAGFALGAATLWGAGTVFARLVLPRLPYLTLTAMRILLAIPFVAVIASGRGGLDESLGGLADSPVRIGVAALGPGLLAVLLFYRGLEGTKASHATLAEFMYPVSALVGNWAVLGIMISVTQLLGLLLVLTAVVALARLSSSNKEDDTPAIPAIQLSTTGGPSLDIHNGERSARRKREVCPVRMRFCSRFVSG